ncbi:unnamed protein product [Heligmosomoides polygyrus]|uniref:Reverse transcriptase domain-containing protein n=1 Tax=Heligmosomoides polygyrus TaxID=6339 RepID=A0A183GDV7_HELPZ|nr:unnamed protein product [Heligmosomoides polygyrus]
MTTTLTRLFNICWHRLEVPEDWKRGVIVKIPKKGDLSECGNWRGVTLLSIPGKVFCLILLNRLRAAVDERLREEQCGFRGARPCSEQIFTLRNVIDQCMKFRTQLLINFVDFRKAFDSVHRESLWSILRIYGIPQPFVEIFKKLYKNSSCCVKTNAIHTTFFEVVTGVRQGCVLSTLLFNVALDFIMRKSMKGDETGIKWSRTHRLTELDFADDVAIIAENNGLLQQATTNLANEAKKIGLRLNPDKSKVISIGKTDMNVDINVEASQLETVHISSKYRVTRRECGIRNTNEDCEGFICVSEAWSNLELTVNRVEDKATALPLNSSPDCCLHE